MSRLEPNLQISSTPSKSHSVGVTDHWSNLKSSGSHGPRTILFLRTVYWLQRRGHLGLFRGFQLWIYASRFTRAGHEVALPPKITMIVDAWPKLRLEPRHHGLVERLDYVPAFVTLQLLLHQASTERHKFYVAPVTPLFEQKTGPQSLAATPAVGLSSVRPPIFMILLPPRPFAYSIMIYKTFNSAQPCALALAVPPWCLLEPSESA